MAQDNKIKIRRGLNANLPAGGTEAGELRYSTDTKELYIDDGAANVKVGSDTATSGVNSAITAAIAALSSVYQAISAKLGAIAALANAAGWLRNDGSGVFSYSTPTASDVGLGNVSNVTSANLPVSTAQQTALDLKANLAGGNALTGNQTLNIGQTTSAQTDLLINPATKASGNLIDLQVASGSKFSVTNAGLVTSAANIVSGGNVDAAATAALRITGRMNIGATNTSLAYISNPGANGLAVLAIGALPPASIGTAPTHSQALSIHQPEELLTIAASPTSVTTMVIPAGAIILSVSARCTVAIPTAATFTVKVGAVTFSTAPISTAANSTDVGTAAGASYLAAATAVTITPNLTPGANTGRVRVSVTYLLITPPTS